LLALVAPPLVAQAQDKPDGPYQYKFESIFVGPASADEPKLAELSVEKAEAYLDQGALAWNGERKCVSCHTNGTYMQIRPALSTKLGPPNPAIRAHYVASLEQFTKKSAEQQQESVAPAQAIYLAAGLAEWDAHVTKSLSTETSDAIALMLDIQLTSGTWGTLDCWPPLESDAYHEATVAAMAIGTAPGWLASLKDDKQKAAVQKLKDYLVNTPPLHDYSRVLLLWASTRMPELVSSEQKAKLAEVVWSHQRPDGGWSIRSFAAPEAWGGGNRAKKLRDEPDFANPASDGHQTGLAILVLRATGVDAKDPRLQRGVEWLKKNQRESGRWWTRSLNTDSWHYITYSGTAYPLLALAACGEIPAKQ